jgi:hypothetical protein
MSNRVGRFEVHEVGKRLQDRIDAAIGHRWPRLGFSLQGQLPCRPLRDLGEDVGGRWDEVIDEARVVGARVPPMCHHLDRRCGAHERSKNFGITGQKHDPGRQGDVVARDAVGDTAAVPALEGVP